MMNMLHRNGKMQMGLNGCQAWRIDVATETFPVYYSESLPDEFWCGKDGHKHRHRWAKKDGRWSVTAAKRRKVRYYVEDGDFIYVDEYRCVKCGDKVVPRFRLVDRSKMIQGSTSWGGELLVVKCRPIRCGAEIDLGRYVKHFQGRAFVTSVEGVKQGGYTRLIVKFQGKGTLSYVA